jgi:hypothetical protein
MVSLLRCGICPDLYFQVLGVNIHRTQITSHKGIDVGLLLEVLVVFIDFVHPTGRQELRYWL